MMTFSLNPTAVAVSGQSDGPACRPPGMAGIANPAWPAIAWWISHRSPGTTTVTANRSTPCALADREVG
ncbi:MAG: hypothetical protein M0Z53_01285 [Thermaerobacter sp.]|nr:hypothetical protein [Thermaerobacter sp.]